MSPKRTAIECIGKSFTRLTVESVDYIRKNNTNIATAKCNCTCGKQVNIAVYNLKNGTTKSCGCLRDETSGSRIANMNAAKEMDGTFRDPKSGSAIRVYRDHHYNDGDLSFEEFLKLSQQECFYCGTPPSQVYNTHIYNKYSSKERVEQGNFIYNGLDRVDNTINHIKSNLVPCCWDCNRAKLKRTKEDFLNWICKVYNYNF